MSHKVPDDVLQRVALFVAGVIAICTLLYAAAELWERYGGMT